MTTERIQLQPGVWLNYVRTNRFKTGCFSMNLLQPLAYSTAASYALIPSVLLRGCQNYPSMQAISKRLDHLFGASVGSLVRKKGEVQSVGLYADFLEDRYAASEPVFQQMMDFIQELVFTPCIENGGFIEEFTTGEKINLINTIDARLNDKRSYAISRLLKHMCKGETYAVPRLGEKKTLDAATPARLYEDWKQLLKTSPMELFYLGQQEKGSVVDTMQYLLKDLPERAVQPAGTTAAAAPHRPVQYIEESMDVTQGKLAMGFRTPITVHDSRYPALFLMNAIYGSGMTSKLFLKIREEQSLCYYANSSFDKLKGILVVGSGIEFDNYQKAHDGILEQLDLCRKGEISEEEIESARTYLISALHTGKDSPGRLDDYAITQAVAGRTDSLDDLADQLTAVTKDQIVEAANTLILDTVYFLKGVEA